jgi:copper chaperone CopZ
MSVVTYTVRGMTCHHCERAIRQEIGGLTGVVEVQVDVESGAVAVHSENTIDPDAIAAAVERAGYQVTG